MLHFVDANCMIGTRQQIREGSLKNTQEHFSLMDDLGIKKAVVFHSFAKEADCRAGNSLLENETDGYKCFLKQWVVMPNIWGEFIQPEQLIVEMRQKDVRSVRLFPLSFNHSLKPYASGELISILSQHQVPIFIDRDQFTAWENIYDLCQDYPEAKFILCNTGYNCTRQLVPLMYACHNLYIDTSTLLMHQSIRDFCSYFGSQRLIFGSGAPIGSMAAAVSLIRYSDIPVQDKEQIAYKNIEKLLREATL